MGKYNSSIHRVRPLMQVVGQDHKAFEKLLSLVGISHLSAPKVCRYDGTDCTEMQLKPPKKHLAALIDHMAQKDHGTPAALGKDRMDLFYGSAPQRQAACIRAKAELDANYDNLRPNDRKWYVFEGFTNPDIFVEGEDYVIVCEGKWTESNITTTTTHLCSKDEYRNQMIRHIQGALNYSRKKVYAFYIVDAQCGYTEALSKESLCTQLTQETIKLEAGEYKAVADAFYGYTTWQDIKSILPEVDFKDKHQI